MLVGILDPRYEPPSTAKLVPNNLIILIIFVSSEGTSKERGTDEDDFSMLFPGCYDLFSTLPDTIFG